MKFFKSKIFLLSLVLATSFVALPLATLKADTTPDCGATGVKYDPGTGLCLKDTSTSKGFLGATTISDLILKVITLLLSLAAIIAVVFIIIGGYRYITAAGNEEGAKAGRSILTNAAIGLIIVILAYTIVTIVKNTVTSSNGSTIPSSSPATVGSCGSEGCG